ncbi:MAG: type II toxin-antitoxin system VapC family toxin [bacterium]|nr:type II toxin-antitoxin system VapC family toxin [bacterium]
MNGKYLLDTNIVIPLLAGDSWISQKVQRADELFIPVIAIGELLYGAQKSARRTENIAKIEAFIRENVVLPCEAETASQYGEIKNQLRQKGRPIPENDIWIAAIAR